MEVTVLDNVEVTLLIISAIFLLIVLRGGGFEISAIRVPRVTAPARLFAGLFLLAQVVDFLQPPLSTIPITATYAPEEAPNLSVQSAATSARRLGASKFVRMI